MSVYDDVRLEFSCGHDEREVRRRTLSNGIVHYWEQCMRCGAAIRAVKKGSVRFGADPTPDFDEGLREGWQASMRLAYEAARESASPDDFWDRYERHLASPEWAAIRDRVLVRAGGLCEGCGLRRPVHVHHTTYERLGNEMLFDLQAVCRPCHERLHPHLSTRLSATVFRHGG